MSDTSDEDDLPTDLQPFSGIYKSKDRKFRSTFPRSKKSQHNVRVSRSGL